MEKIIIIRVEINEMENRKTMKKINETKMCSVKDEYNWKTSSTTDRRKKKLPTSRMKQGISLQSLCRLKEQK